ncbi:MAG: GTPase ObgE [Chloroflexi bacterium]|nr:GTPase ObgE [Chloroflexota bacterium]
MVDNAEIVVKGGNGGDGAVTFHREKFAPRGGPDGGDGGTGGDVFIVADRNIDDLSRFKAQRRFQAENGQPGGRNKKSGRTGQSLVVGVPVGTQVRDTAGPAPVLLADLTYHGDRVSAAKGGRGGWGNMHFATPSHQLPMEARPGARGEEKRISLELRLMADVALIGKPNSGKSTLLRSVSRATPEVADYPFSTREPVLGSVEVRDRSIVLIELPGLIEGSHQGKGLGNGFLKHAQRAGSLLFLVAGDSPDPISDFLTVRGEVYLYDESLKSKPQLVAVTRTDLPSVRGRIPWLRRRFLELGIVPFFVSGTTGKGVQEMLQSAVSMVVELEIPPEAQVAVFRPKPKARRPAEDGA